MAKRTTTDKVTDRLRDGRDRGLIRISAKALGELALPTFCARCFWLKRKMRNRLPFRQPLPGVFSAIDSITKEVVHGIFDAHDHLPPWLARRSAAAARSLSSAVARRASSACR